MSELVGKFDGRVVDSAGDCLLAEFASVVDAVHCALEIQQGLQSRNGYLPEGRKMEFRIGINLGDVIGEEGKLYGDGVNIAARVEQLSGGGEKRFEEALANARKCCELEPNYINSIYIPGHVLTYVGKEEAEEAIGLIKEVFEPAPFPRLTIQ